MRFLLCFIIACLALVLVSSTPIDPYNWLMNRSAPRFTRVAQVKGQPGVKGYNPQPPSLNLRKGEYMCGNKVCKLKPGEIPKGCNGVCQYPLDTPIYP